MRSSTVSRAAMIAVLASTLIAPASFSSAAAQEQAASISVPAMPLEAALRSIADQSGTAIAADPDAVAGKRSRPVQGAASAAQAVEAVISGMNLTSVPNPNGGLMVVADIVVTAARDEAETSVLVRSTSTSSRLGESLREQAKNTQVISARVMAEQQVRTIPDALRNAGGVVVNTATGQGGTTYSVRGFSSGGLVNGLPGAANGGVAAGVTQSVANVERVEVLKGPDAILAGVDNLGGAVNIVAKKPSADPYFYVSAETGSWGQIRGTLDATSAITDDRKLSARIIATAADADRNFGGYRGNEDYLFAPSLRYKSDHTDITVGVTATDQIFGQTPFVPVNPETNELFDAPRNKPIISPDQYIRIGTTRYYGEATQDVTPWLTLSARGQHEKLNLNINFYSVAFVASGDGLLGLLNGQVRQTGESDALDAFARIKLSTGPVDHTLVAGYTYVRNVTTAFSASATDFIFYNFLTDSNPPPLARIDTTDYRSTNSQNGLYAQYAAKFGGLKLVAGVRHNKYTTGISFPGGDPSRDSASATTTNFGAVYDVTDNLSLFGSLAEGYSPTFVLDRNLAKLPDTRSRNLEGGIKLDLMHDKLFLVASYFRLRQSNLIISDPADPGFSIAIDGQEGKGIDLSLTGEVVKGLQVQASYTHSSYKPLTPSPFGNVVQGQPRDQYSLYASYSREVANDVTAGLGGGIYGRSKATVDSFGDFYVPASLQVDLNGFLKLGALDINLGVRNIFDRTNYAISYTPQFIPYMEPRNWRLTIGYRFK